MIVTNRPLVPIKLTRSDFFPISFASFDYFSDNISVIPPAQPQTYHGLTKRFAANAGLWDPIVQVFGAGLCSFLGVAAKNNTAQVQQFGVQVFFNGGSVYVDERIECPANSQLGFTLLGHMFFRNNALFSVSANVWAPFDNALVVYAYTPNPSDIEVVVARRVYMTL